MLTLKDFSTRHLLKEYRRSAAYSWDLLWDRDAGKLVSPKIFLRKPVKGGTEEYLEISTEELKEELNRREHIPSSAEAKAIRKIQAKAKSGLSYEEARKQYEQQQNRLL